MELDNTLSEKAKNDLVLVEMAKNGNEKAFSMLLNRYRDSIYFMLIKIANNPRMPKTLQLKLSARHSGTLTPLPLISLSAHGSLRSLQTIALIL